MPTSNPITPPADAQPALSPLTPEELQGRSTIAGLSLAGRMQPRDFDRLKELDGRGEANNQLPVSQTPPGSPGR